MHALHARRIRPWINLYSKNVLVKKIQVYHRAFKLLDLKTNSLLVSNHRTITVSTSLKSHKIMYAMF